MVRKTILFVDCSNYSEWPNCLVSETDSLNFKRSYDLKHEAYQL